MTLQCSSGAPLLPVILSVRSSTRFEIRWIKRQRGPIISWKISSGPAHSFLTSRLVWFNFPAFDEAARSLFHRRTRDWPSPEMFWCDFLVCRLLLDLLTFFSPALNTSASNSKGQTTWRPSAPLHLADDSFGKQVSYLNQSVASFFLEEKFWQHFKVRNVRVSITAD